MKYHHYLSLLFVSCLALFSSSGRAETVMCTPITSLPAQITSQGVFCLTAKRGTSITTGVAIEILTNNVVLDLNGFALGGLGGGAGTQAVGISGTNVKNITIKNGAIRGYYVGVSLTGASSSGNVIEDLIIEQSRNNGIDVEGIGNRVQRNQVLFTGGSVHSLSSYGIQVASGSAATSITDNTVINMLGGSGGDNSVGILVRGSSSTMVVNDNRIITGLATAGGCANTAFSMEGPGTGYLMLNNRIMNYDCGGFFSPSGLFRDNVFVGVGAAYPGVWNAADGGGNFPAPPPLP